MPQLCGKKGHPAKCCTQKKGKTKKDTDDVKSVSSSKSNKTIESLTKQVKMLKKLVSALQAHNKVVKTTLASPVKREMRTSSIRVPPLPPPIRMWPWLSNLLKLGIWISGVYGS